MAGRSLRFNVVANVVGGGVNMVGQLIALPLAILIAGPGPYGAWVALFAIVQLTALFDLGLAPAVIRRIAELTGTPGRQDELRRVTATGFLLNALLSLAAAVITGLAAWGLSTGASGSTVSHSDELALAVTAVVAAACGVTLRQFQAVNQGIERFDIERLHQTIGIVVRIAALGVALALHGSLLVVAVIEAVTLLLPGAISGLRIRRFAPFFSASPRSFDRSEARGLLRFGTGWFSLASATQLATFLPPFLAGLLAGPVAATAVGAGLRVAQALRQMMAWLLDPLLPNLMTVTPAQRDRLTIRGTQGLALLGAAGIVPLLLEAPVLMRVWLGPAAPWQDASSYFRAFGFAMLLTVAHLTVAVVVQARNRPATFAVATWFSALGTLGLLGVALGVRPDLAPATIVLVAVVAEALFLLRARTAVTGRTFRGIAEVLARPAVAALLGIAAWAALRIHLTLTGLAEAVVEGLVYLAGFGLVMLVISRLSRLRPRAKVLGEQ